MRCTQTPAIRAPRRGAEGALQLTVQIVQMCNESYNSCHVHTFSIIKNRICKKHPIIYSPRVKFHRTGAERAGQPASVTARSRPGTHPRHEAPADARAG